MVKKCGKCGEVKSYCDFHKQSKNKTDGLQSVCKSCRKIIDKCHYGPKKKASIRQRRDDLIGALRQYKEEKGCKYCSERCGVALDFHHANSNKEFSVMNAITRYSEDRLWQEAKKCDVVCANCHRKIHGGIFCPLV